MSARKSKLRKILRAASRQEKKQADARAKYRKPGETDEMMEARMKRDLSGWLEMVTEREVEEALTTQAAEQKVIEDMQKTEEE